MNINFNDTATAFAYLSNSQLKKSFFLFKALNNNTLSKLGTSFLQIALKIGLPVEKIIYNTIYDHFCGGLTIQDSEEKIDELAVYHVQTILDYSVEGQEEESGLDQTAEEILATIEFANEKSSIPFCVFKLSGLASNLLLEKIQAGVELSGSEQAAFDRVTDRVNRICGKSHEYGIPILIDAEETWIQDPIDQLVYQMMARYNQEKPIVFNTYQMYRADMLDNLKKALHYAVADNYYLGAKLVRGAYMEKERERAKEKGYPSPIHPTKEDTDTSFDQALKFCVDNKQRISLVAGSHNEQSNYLLTVLMEKHSMKPGDTRVWFSQLYGMSDNISFNLAANGYNVVKYLPYGPVKAVMPYLIRRAAENSSVAGQSSRELMLISQELERRRQSG